MFFYSILTLFFLSFFYNFIFKNILFVDIISISINFVIKAISGIFLIQAKISVWIIISTFFLAFFLALNKRRSELSKKGRLYKYRPLLKNYSQSMVDKMINLTITILIISFFIYTIITSREMLLITIPVILYIIAKYFEIVDKDKIVGRNLEMILKHRSILVSIILWLILTIFVLYFIY